MKRLTKREPDGTAVPQYDDCGWWGKILNRLADAEDIWGDSYNPERLQELMEADRMNRVMILPYPIGTKLYRVTHPYRKDAKVTEYIVKGFRTSGKKHRLQLEVAVNGVPGTNYMYPKDFYGSREEAEAALEEENG